MDTSSIVSLSEAPRPVYNISAENISKATEELDHLLGSESIILNLDERRAHSITKWSPAASSQIPALIVLPTSTADVSEIMKICSRRRIPVTAYCGGTSMPGALAATQRGLCIDFHKMDRILAVHQGDFEWCSQLWDGKILMLDSAVWGFSFRQIHRRVQRLAAW